MSVIPFPSSSLTGRAQGRPTVAIVGGGVSGIYAAYKLQHLFDVTLFESKQYLGGHTNTVTLDSSSDPVPYIDSGARIDTGFIVLNDKNYPLFHGFLAELGVEVKYSNMSFGYADEREEFSYAGTGLNGLFARRLNFFNPQFYSLLAEIVNFGGVSLQALEDGSLRELTLKDWLKINLFSKEFERHYLVPMAGAIWSLGDNEALEFPAETLVRFFKNHGLLSFKQRPRWQTVAGGSKSYVEAFLRRFRGQIECGADILSMREEQDKVELSIRRKGIKTFDYVISALHADLALAVLTNPSVQQHKLLSRWRYSRNATVLHTDDSVMPRNKNAWASWNYTRCGYSRPVQVTYWMNSLQKLDTAKNYFVSLNSGEDINPKKVIRRISYQHPIFSMEALATQANLPLLNMSGRIKFCGSYFGYGFHEDAVRSAFDASSILVEQVYRDGLVYPEDFFRQETGFEPEKKVVGLD